MINSGKKVSTIAHRMHRGLCIRLLVLFLILDILLIALSFAGFFLFSQINVMGAYDFSLPQSFRLSAQGEEFISSFTRSSGLEKLLFLFNLPTWRQIAHDSAYLFFYQDVWHSAPLRPFLQSVEPCFSALILIQLFFLLLLRLLGGGWIRRSLKPFSHMAKTARQLSDQSAASPYSKEQLQKLENAIQSLSPEQTAARLTGDQELKGLEEAINSLLSRMHTAYAQQARFVSDASHELRTPIAVIQGYANMLDRWGKQDEAILDESIAAIKTESAHMKTLVEQLLFLARGDSGRQPLHMAPFSLSAMMREVHEEYLMIDPTHTWKLDVPGEITYTGDESMIKQAVRILADNAAKYTPAGGDIWLKAFMRQGKACFCVQDSGIGMEKDVVPHIFERFYRADAARSATPGKEEKAGGTGLGLSIAGWIVQQHSGYFEVKSWVDLGTRITVCLGDVPLPREENSFPTS